MSQNSTHTTEVDISSLRIQQTESGQTSHIVHTVVEVPKVKDNLESSPALEQSILLGALGIAVLITSRAARQSGRRSSQ